MSRVPAGAVTTTESDRLLQGLNPAQAEAVAAPDQPVLVLAGAGSGKTRVLTHRIAYLIATGRAAEDSVLAVTFTNKAAREMRSRLSGLLGAEPRGMWLGTFHACAARMLRMRGELGGVPRDFVIYDEADRAAVVKEAMRRAGVEEKRTSAATVAAEISRAKNDLQDSLLYGAGAQGYVEGQVARVFPHYELLLEENRALDFDDLLLRAVRLVEDSEQARHDFRRRFQHVLVDEYQDTNRAQYMLLRLLVEEHRRVTVVGDPDQSVYSWRGADIRNILEFQRDYPDALVIPLEQNYRSTAAILRAAGSVIQENSLRVEKSLWTEGPEGSPVTVAQFYDEREEATAVAREILALVEAGEAQLGDVAVLYRTNAQSRLMEEALRRYNIGYTMVGGFSFYERAEIKDMLCYLRLIRNPHDSMAFQRVINTPARGIGKTTLETVERLALETGVSTWDAAAAAAANRLLPARALLALESFRQLILDAQALMDPDFAGKLAADLAAAQPQAADTAFAFGASEASQTREHPHPTPEFGADAEEAPSGEEKEASGFRSPGGAATLPELIRFLIDRTGYIKALEAEGSPESFSRIENLKELANAAHDAEARGETLADFLDHAALASDTDQFDPNASVTLMTLHSAKGLEFPLVFLAGLEEGLFPHSRTLNSPEELEEERRLCYVGMTRAMDTLILTRAHYRRRYGNDAPEASIPSRFLEEVPSQLIENLGSRGLWGEGEASAQAGRGSWGGSRAWAAPSYAAARRQRRPADFDGRHFNYEDESQETHPAAKVSRSYAGREAGSKDTGAAPTENAASIDNIARFFGAKSGPGRPGAFPRPVMNIAQTNGATRLKKGQRVRHAKYGEGTVLVREGEGEDAKLTVHFQRHGIKKLMEKFANLQKI